MQYPTIFLCNQVVDIAKQKPSARGELEITAVNNVYLKKGNFSIVRRGMVWLDTGAPNNAEGPNMLAIQSAGLYISCLEEIAWRRNFISSEQLRSTVKALRYGITENIFYHWNDKE